MPTSILLIFVGLANVYVFAHHRVNKRVLAATIDLACDNSLYSEK